MITTVKLHVWIYFWIIWYRIIESSSSISYLIILRLDLGLIFFSRSSHALCSSIRTYVYHYEFDVFKLKLNLLVQTQASFEIYLDFTTKYVLVVTTHLPNVSFRSYWNRYCFDLCGHTSNQANNYFLYASSLRERK